MISWQALTLNGYLRLTMKRGGNRPIDPQQMRETFRNYTASRSALRELRTDDGLAFGIAPATAIDEPPGAPACVVLYLHGGGYLIGSPQTHQGAVIATAEAFDAPVYALDYRLAPEHPFPAAFDDASAAYEWLLARHPGIPIVLAGDSAGGGLAVAVAAFSHARGLQGPAALVTFSAFCDLAVTGDSIEHNARSCAMLTPQGVRQAAALYLAGGDPLDPRASPLYADLSGLPPMLLFASRDELLLDDTVRLAERARLARVSVQLELRDRLPHAWPIFVSMLPEAREAFEVVETFARQVAAQRVQT
jgi:epsilon-lactone hydrolase